MVVCLPHFEVVQHNAAKQHQMEGVNENLRRVCDTCYEMTFGDKARFPEHRVVYRLHRPRQRWSALSSRSRSYIDDRQERMTG